MCITTFIAGVDTAGPDRRGDGRAANVLFIKNNRAFKFLEPAFHLEPEIPDRELDSRVCRIEMPHTLTRAVHRHDHLVTPVILLTGGFASKVQIILGSGQYRER